MTELPKLMKDRGGLASVKAALREMARNQTMGMSAVTAEMESLKEEMRRGFGTMISGLNGVARLLKVDDPANVSGLFSELPCFWKVLLSFPVATRRALRRASLQERQGRE